MVEVSYERLATIFKALSDETRLHIIDMLSCNELCAADILASFNLSQSTLSYHMKILIDAGVVNSQRNVFGLAIPSMKIHLVTFWKSFHNCTKLKTNAFEHKSNTAVLMNTKKTRNHETLDYAC